MKIEKNLTALGLNKSSAARHFGMSRQQIHNIINSGKVPPMMLLLINIYLAMSDDERDRLTTLNKGK